MDWLEKALEIVDGGGRCVLVTVAATAGSAPREAGAKLLVWAAGTAGTIGGGHLEFAATVSARRLMGEAALARVESVALGPALGQCCGGRVSLCFEVVGAGERPWLEAWANRRAGVPCVAVTRVSGPGAGKTLLDSSDPVGADVPPAVRRSVDDVLRQGCGARLVEDEGETYLIDTVHDALDALYLFGAGHVGRALVEVLGKLPYRVAWIDSRADAFPASPPGNVSAVVSLRPALEVDKAPAGTLFLVLTHSHAVDLEICERVLRRGDFAFLGLIGSATKRARFLKRFAARGIAGPALARLVCPIGIPGIASKAPAAIAVAAAAQLLQLSDGRRRQAADWAANAPAPRAAGRERAP